MAERREDPMRLWIGKWTPEGVARPLTTEQADDKRPAVEEDRRVSPE